MSNDRPSSEYLHALDRALRALPPAERDSIVREIQSHIEERTAGGSDAQQVLSALGPADTLAAAFVDQHQLYRALAAPSPARLLAAVLNRATTNIANLLIAIAGLSLFAFGVSFLAIAVFKIISPEHVGYWKTAAGSDFGIIASPPAGTTERLGMWIIPVSLLASVLCYLVAITLLRRRADWLVRNTTALPPT
jgi:uncharacterized membrane protein